MALHQQLPLCFNLIKIAWSHITRQEAWESNSATALDSLGLSLPYMEDGEKGTITSDEKALELFFCSKKRQLTRSGKQDWGRCRNSGPLENNRLGLELGQALELCSGDSGSHFSFEESFLIQRSLSNSDPASHRLCDHRQAAWPLLVSLPVNTYYNNTSLLWKLNEIIHKRCLTKCVVHLCISYYFYY